MYIKKNNTWSTVKAAYVKKDSSWAPIKKIYLKATATLWLQFFPSSGPYTTESPKIRLHTYRIGSASGSQPPTDVYAAISMGPGGTRGFADTIADGESGTTYLWGYDGTWENNTNATITRSMLWNTTDSAGSAITISGVTDKLANTQGVIDLYDNNYIWYRVVESVGSNSGSDTSASLLILRQQPPVPTISITSPTTATTGVSISAPYNAGSIWYSLADLSKSYIEWFAESSSSSPLLDSTTFITGTKQYLLDISSSRTGTATFTPQDAQLGKYIYAKITLANSYTDYYGDSYKTTTSAKTTVKVEKPIIQNGGVKRTIYTGVTIGTSQIFDVSTNGYVGYNVSSKAYAGPSSLPTGTFLNFFGVQDLVQSSLYYNATDTGYTIDWAGWKYNDQTQFVEYYATFYWNSDRVDVYFASNYMSSNVDTSDAAVITNGTVVKTWSSNSTSLSSYTMPESLTLVSSVSSGDTDDGYTILNASKPIPVPTISTYPTISRNSQDSYVYTTTNGSWTGTPISYRYQWYTYEQTSGAQYSYFPISGATSSSFDASAYKASYQIVCVVWATNAGGESNSGYALYNTAGTAISSSAGGAASSNTLTVYYKAPVISLSASSPSYTTLRYNYSVTRDDSGGTIVGQYKTSAGSTWTTITLGNQNINNDFTITAGTYDFRIIATNTSTYGNSYQTIQSVTGIVVNANPLPQSFNITASTKYYPNSSAPYNRVVDVTWGQSVNANKYEVQIQASSDASSWTTLQTFAASPYINEPTRTASYTLSQYKYYRFAVRASNANGDMVYNGGGSLASPVYYNAVGYAPGDPTIGTIVSGSDGTSVSLPYTATNSPGSSYYSGVQYSTDGISWSGTTTSNPISITGLTAATSYTFYLRSINGDDIVSSGVSSSFTTIKIPNYLAATTNDSTKIRLSWSGGYGSDYQFYWTSSTGKPTNQGTYFDFAAGSATSPYDWTGGGRGVNYYFFIRSKLGTTVSDWYPASAPGSYGYMPLYAPNVPTSLSTSSVTSSGCTFSWSAPSTDSSHDAAASYDYTYNTTGSTPASGTNTSSTSASLSLSASTIYYLWVRARNADAVGAWTYTTVTTPAAAVAPTSVTATPSWSKTYTHTNGVAYQISGGTVSVSASANGTSPTLSYVWQYQSVNGGGWADAAGFAGYNTSSFTIPASWNGFAVRCVVTATNSAGSATGTTESSGPIISLTATPAPVTGGSVSDTAGVGGTFSWTQNAETPGVGSGFWNYNYGPTWGYNWTQFRNSSTSTTRPTTGYTSTTGTRAYNQTSVVSSSTGWFYYTIAATNASGTEGSRATYPSAGITASVRYT